MNKKKLLWLLALLAVVLFFALRNQKEGRTESADTPVAQGETEIICPPTFSHSV